LFRFFTGNASCPDFYSDQLICDSLSISKTELDKQPFDWVMKMMDYFKIKAEYQDFKSKSAKKRQTGSNQQAKRPRVRKK